MTTMKLQKLMYYAQAWCLIAYKKPLFPEQIQAWEYGPVVYVLFQEHRGRFVIDKLSNGSADRVDSISTQFLDKILDYYGKFSGQDLSIMTHKETPWIQGNASEDGIITKESLIAFFSAIQPPFSMG